VLRSLSEVILIVGFNCFLNVFLKSLILIALLYLFVGMLNSLMSASWLFINILNNFLL
jgi:hypothetical protein